MANMYASYICFRVNSILEIYLVYAVTIWANFFFAILVVCRCLMNYIFNVNGEV
jgi:hypothetical protein